MAFRRAFLLLFTLTASAVVTAGGSDVDQDIPIALSTYVNPQTKKGDPIPLAVTVENGMKGPISYGTFSLDPVPWNGEASSLTLVDIYRNGEPGGLFIEGPKVEPPSQMQGMNHFVLKRNQSLVVKTDIAKWRIKGGWIPGHYTVTARVENIATDRGRNMISVLSEPFSFEVIP